MNKTLIKLEYKSFNIICKFSLSLLFFIGYKKNEILRSVNNNNCHFFIYFILQMSFLKLSYYEWDL